MSFLLRNKNLFDLPDISEARKNLGLGSMALLNSNDIKITGGSIVADTFVFSDNGKATENSYLRSIDNSGNCEWFKVPTFDWLKSNQEDILLSDFSNDCEYIKKMNYVILPLQEVLMILKIFQLL